MLTLTEELNSKSQICLGKNITIHCGKIEGITVDSAGKFKEKSLENNNSCLLRSPLLQHQRLKNE